MEKREKKKFGTKQILMLLFSILISVLIIVFSKQIANFKEFGYLGAFLLTFLGNATVLVPVPVLAPLNILLGGILAIPLLVGLAIGLGSALGELVGYIAGYSGSEIVKSTNRYKRMETKINKYGIWAIFMLALIPNPLFDIAGLAAGAAGIAWWKFLIAAGIGKTIRAIAFAYIGYTGSLII